MSKIFFKVENDVVVRHTPVPEIGINIYKTDVVMTKDTFQECYKKWIEDKEKMTNQEKFIQIFGIEAWQQVIVFSGLAEQFKEYWTSPYNERKE